MRSAGTGTPPSRDCDLSRVPSDSKATACGFYFTPKGASIPGKNVPGPTPPNLHGHPKQLYTNLSKVVCVLLIVGTVLRRTERCRSELTSTEARPAEDKDTHDVAVVGFGHQ